MSADVPNHFESRAACASASDKAEDLDEDEELLRFEYFRCPIHSEGVVRDLLQGAALFVAHALARGRPVLLHGPPASEQEGNGDGSADAGLVAAAYLVHVRGLSPAAAADAVRTRRPTAELPEVWVQWLRKLGDAAAPVPSVPSGTGVQEAETNAAAVDAGAVALDMSPPAASEIVDGFLWLGGADAATTAGLRQLGIDCVVNVTPALPFADVMPLRKLRVSIEPSAGLAALVPHWQGTMEFIESARREGRRVLVHGTMGRSRAAAVAVDYIMRSHNLTLAAAMREVRQRRPTARPSAALATAVQELATAGGGASGAAVGSGADPAPLDPAAVEAKATAPPLAIEDGSAAPISGPAFEAAMQQLGELFPVPVNVRREALSRHSGNVERAANYCLAWMERRESRGSMPTIAEGSESKALDAGLGSLVEASLGRAASHCVSAEGGGGGSSASASTSARGSTSASSSSARVEAPHKLLKLVQSYVGGEEQLPECVICCRTGLRCGTLPVQHADLGWVHDSCLTEAGWA